MNFTLLDYIKNQLETNPAWASRAIVKLYEYQTMDEQITGQTANVNGVGFNGLDSVILSSFAQQLLKGRSLTAKQLAIAHKKLPKYGKQVMGLIPAEKLEQLKAKVEAWQVHGPWVMLGDHDCTERDGIDQRMDIHQLKRTVKLKLIN